MPDFQIPMIRIGTGFATIEVKGVDSLAAAQEIALDTAGDHLYNEKHSEYELADKAPADTFGKFPEKDLHLEAYANGDGDSPSFASTRVTPAFLRLLTSLSAVIKQHGLENVEISTFKLGTSYPSWQSNNWEGQMPSDNLVVDGGAFWFSGYPKHADYLVQTRPVSIQDLLEAMALSELTLYMGNDADELKNMVDEEAEDDTASSDNAAN